MLQELTEARYKLECTVRDVTMKQSVLEADNSRLESELFSVRRDYTSLGSDRTDQEREMTQLRMKLAVVEQDLKMKDEQLIRAAEELSLERDEKVCLSLCQYNTNQKAYMEDVRLIVSHLPCQM